MNRHAFKRVVLSQKDRVHTYAAWMIRDMEDSRDITQQALMRLWEYRSQVTEAAAATWLRRTTHRLCVDRLRRRTVRSEVSLGALVDSRSNGDAGPRETLASAELRHRVGAALAELGPRDRAVVVLREMDGLSYEQMSHVLGLPLGTLKTTLHRARERVRRALTGAEVER